MACIQFKSGLFNEKVIFEESKKICKILINLIKDVDIVLVLMLKHGTIDYLQITIMLL
jgi:hypothetical protein